MKKNILLVLIIFAMLLVIAALVINGLGLLDPAPAEATPAPDTAVTPVPQETAAAEPDVLFVAVERVPDAMVIAMERAKAAGLANVFFIDADVARLRDYFSPDEVERIYINFCDPWPSKRHAKRRLTHGNFLKLYRQVLKMGGQIHFKTDNQPLFEFSVEELPQFGFELSEVTRNLHENGPVGVMTDYEAKFHELGQPINRCVGTMVDWEESEVPEDAEPAEETVKE